jgi:hypothetical protein
MSSISVYYASHFTAQFNPHVLQSSLRSLCSSIGLYTSDRAAAFSEMWLWGYIYFLISLCYIPSLASPLPHSGTSIDLAPRANEGFDGICFLRSLQTTFNRFAGNDEVDISDSFDITRGDDPGNLPWITITRHPFLSYRAWRQSILSSTGTRTYRYNLQVRNSGPQRHGLTLERPQGTFAPLRFVPIDVAEENIVTGQPSITCTMIDNPTEGVYILRTLT